MKTKRILIPMLTAAMIASTLTGCAAGTQNELVNLINEEQEIEIVVAMPDGAESVISNVSALEWVKLASKTSDTVLRQEIDKIFGIVAHGTQGKAGVLYSDGQYKDVYDNTLYNVFKTKEFRENYWNNTEKMQEVIQAVKNAYADVETDEEAIATFINSYFELFVQPNGYFKGESTVTRAEFLSGVYKAYTPVKGNISLLIDDSLMEIEDSNTPFVSAMLDHSYLNTTDNSLNESTYNGVITKAEAIYTIVNTFFKDDYNSISESKTSKFTDVKNLGDIKGELEKENTGISKTDYTTAVILNNVLENTENGLPSDLYKAIIVAEEKGILDHYEETTLGWELGLTRQEAIELIIKSFEQLEVFESTELQEQNLTEEADPLAELYAKLDCFTNVYMDAWSHIGYTDEWKEAVSSFPYCDGVTGKALEYFLDEFAIGGWHRYDGKTAYEKLTELSNKGSLLDEYREDRELALALGVDLQEEEENNSDNNNNNNNETQKPSGGTQNNTKPNTNNSNKDNNSNQGNNNNNNSNKDTNTNNNQSQGECITGDNGGKPLGSGGVSEFGDGLGDMSGAYAENATYVEMDPDFQLRPGG